MNQSTSNSQPIAVIAGARTPLSKAFTDLADVSAVQLGTHAVTAAVTRAAAKTDGMEIDQVDELVMGNVAGPPDAANIGRVIALSAGLPNERIAHTVTRNCASGMESIFAAWDSIARGRASIVISGGTESMSQVPMLFRRDAAKNWMRLARSKTIWQKLKTLAAFRPRHFKPVVGIQLGLTDPVSGLNMGETAEVLAREFGISREEQDAFALLSHQRASAAREECFLSGEIAEIETKRGIVAKDNGPRDGRGKCDSGQQLSVDRWRRGVGIERPFHGEAIRTAAGIHHRLCDRRLRSPSHGLGAGLRDGQAVGQERHVAGRF